MPMEDIPYVISCTASSITLRWEAKCKTDFEVKFQEDTIKGFTCIQTQEQMIDIHDLKADTLYNVKVFVIDEGGCNHEILQVKIKTEVAQLLYLRDPENVATIDKREKPFKYHLKPVDVQDDVNVRTCYLIAKDKTALKTTDEKILLILGATGTGKSTFIDALFNYLAGVSFRDDFRFTIINKNNEELKREEDQSKSQTTSVVRYTIPKTVGLKIEYRLNIIDTPGFNDTTDTDFDKKIVAKVQDLFKHKIKYLDAVLLVVPSSTSRLTDGQTYVFSSIRKMFGKEIEKNIFIVITHYDGGEPICLPVLQMANIPCYNMFMFNNSNLFSEIKDSSANLIIWKDRIDNFVKLFESLERVKQTSVETSAEVMGARIQLEMQLTSLEQTLSEQIQNVANYKKDKQVCTELKTKSQQDVLTFEYETVESKVVHKFTGKKSINCVNCENTCHENCWVIADNLMWTCEAMVRKKCVVCSGKCELDLHRREKYIYKLEHCRKRINGVVLLELVSNLKASFTTFVTTIDEINKLIDVLKSKALFPDVVSTDAYIENIIEREQREKQPDFEVRVKLLERVVLHIKSGRSIHDLSFDVLTKDI